ncbi:MAG: hypothetical protein IKN38_02010 [Clostridia bacterium]|nr:hypothetical protein [Clostridia bacterium]
MSYCVHCGVELADYETKCPLCETPVVDPSRPISEGEPMFPDRLEVKERKFNKRFIVTLVSFVMLIPFVVTSIIDIYFSLGMTWSAYVLRAEALVWVVALLPFQNKSATPYVFCLADFAGCALYLLLIALLENGMRWYLPVALPICAASWTVIMIVVSIHRRAKTGKITKAGVVLMTLSFLPLTVDIAVSRYLYGSLLPRWAWYASVPLFVFGLTVTLLSKSVRFTDWLRKKLFV